MVQSPCLRGWLEREGIAEDAGAGEATRQNADEVEGGDLDALAVDAVGELAASRTFEHELEWFVVDVRPFGDDVGDEPAVMIGGGMHRPAAGGVQVGAMAPHVAREAAVEQGLER